MGAPLGPTILWVESVGEARALERRLRSAPVSRRSTDVGRVLSVASMVPDRVGEASARIDRMAAVALDLAGEERLKGADAREFNRLLDALYSEPWRPRELPRAIRRRLQPRGGEGTFVLVWPRAQLNIDREIITWTDRMAKIKADLALEGQAVKILDERVITTRVIKMLRRDFPRMVLIASLGALLILALHFRRLVPVLLAAGAVLLGVGFMLGVMRLFEIDLNIFNVMALPMIVGIGVDNAIHILHHSRSAASVSAVVDTVGRAVLLASGTTAIGFGAMLVADHLGIRLLGGVAQAGIAGVFVATTVVLPCVLLLWEGRRRARSAGS